MKPGIIRMSETCDISSIRVNALTYYFLKRTLSKIPTNSYFLGLKYSDDTYQIGVTGTCQVGESKYAAMQREMQEETGLMIKKYVDSIEYENNRQPNFPQDWWFIAAPIDHVEPVKKFVFATGVDDRQKKIGCIVYGECDAIYNKIIDADTSSSIHDGIVDIVIFPYAVVLSKIATMFESRYWRQKIVHKKDNK